MKDRSAAEVSLPLIVANGTPPVRRYRTFQPLRKAILVVTAAAIGAAVLALHDPLAPLVSIESTGLEAAAAAEPADLNHADQGDAPSDSMVQKFLAWAHDQDEQERIAAQARQTQDPAKPAAAAQDAPAQVKPDSAAVPVRVAEKPPRATARVRNAHAELPPKRRHRSKIAHAPRAVAKPDDHALAQDAPAPTPQPPSLLQALGWHD